MEGWLHCVNSRGQKGLMPGSFVRLLAPGESYPPPASQRNRPPSVDYFSQVGEGADRVASSLHADGWGCTGSCSAFMGQASRGERLLVARLARTACP